MPHPDLPTARPRRPLRLRALDGLRGLAVAGLLLVLALQHQPRAHAALVPSPWHGWTPADLLAALFVTVSGASLAFAGQRWRERYDGTGIVLRVVRRVATLALLGLAASFVLGLLTDGPLLRLPGVLQRLALVTLVAAPLVLARARAALGLLALAALVGHTLLLLAPVEAGPGADLGSWLDRRPLGGDLAGAALDPAGVLTTLGVWVTFVTGILAGEYVRRRPLSSAVSARLGSAAALLIVAGTAGETLLPVNRSLWTGSFALLGAGWSLLLLALAYECGDVRGWRALTAPWAVFGRNALLATLAAVILFAVLERVPIGMRDGEPLTVWRWLYEAAHLGDPASSSLVVALGALLLAWTALYPLYRLRATFVA